MAAQITHVPSALAAAPIVPPSAGEFRGQALGLVVRGPGSRGRGLSGGFAGSLVAHLVLLTAVVLVPLLAPAVLPEPGVGVKAFFATPAEIAPAPPPPPPPPAPTRALRAQVPVPRATEPPRFVAPIAVPELVKPENDGLSLLGVEGGVPGGVEGGVPGGVVGGVVGGLPTAAPPPVAREAVRIGGAIVAPKVVRRVAPEYPYLAVQVRATGTVVAEAHVDEQGRVTSVTILSGNPIFTESVVAAVQQWRFQPLLLNGVPTPFILNVSLHFNLLSPGAK